MDFIRHDPMTIFGALLRRYPIIVATTLISLIIAACALALLRPVYSATVLLLYEPRPSSGNHSAPSGPISVSRLESEVEIARSTAVLLHLFRLAPELVWKELGQARSLLRVPFIADTEVAPVSTELSGETLRTLGAVFSIHRRGLTQLISIEARSTSPEGAAELANGLAMAYEANQIARKRKEISGGRDALLLPDTTVVAPALVPDRPVFPNRPLTLGLTGFFGMLTGITIVLLLERQQGGFASEDDLRSTLRVGTAPSLPLSAFDDPMRSAADLILDDPQSAFADAIRHLQIKASYNGPRHGGSVIAIIGATDGVGVTTTALAMGRAFAVDGLSTLLIDANLRAPDLARQMSVAAPSGLLAQLESDTSVIDVSRVIAADPMSILTVLLGGGERQTPGHAHFSSAKWSELLTVARRTYAVVILDAGSLERGTDALQLARYADVVVLMATWSATPRAVVRNGANQLLEATSGRVPILGVLNQAPSRRARRRPHPSQKNRAQASLPDWSVE